ncbi:unnamed protein product [Vitrella brassicaformis CCMP3155]|uniref:Protein SDA1 n=1 Tax=Vitrella brassicaformis (strain CCMP3155) TaxID=1169540 RepID=A0A0G4EB42_VITBC|nr:unnamed protein product [Vitrella brassicaformis CCMP3155]|eukprot:CEL92915.1 unnamed protein product [Vitrella brassicaformis CCMP3155]
MAASADTNKPLSLPVLQDLIKRDPEAYREEYESQEAHFSSSLSILRLKPNKYDKDFNELTMLLTHVTPCYQNQQNQQQQNTAAATNSSAAGKSLRADTDRVNPDDLRGVSKKKRTRAEKLASVLRGRVDKKNKGKNKGAGAASAAVVSMPNAVKSRNKPIMMMRNKRALMAGLRKHIKNQLRMKTGGKARRRKK